MSEHRVKCNQSSITTEQTIVPLNSRSSVMSKTRSKPDHKLITNIDKVSDKLWGFYVLKSSHSSFLSCRNVFPSVLAIALSNLFPFLTMVNGWCGSGSNICVVVWVVCSRLARLTNCLQEESFAQIFHLLNNFLYTCTFDWIDYCRSISYTGKNAVANPASFIYSFWKILQVIIFLPFHNFFAHLPQYSHVHVHM